ncbi:hypothetical protein SDC9_196653 [bioreactor metagenome]|uniref:Uncharacterized protein n=1 Tax=bioreactor metagenome TaxID=1076179 RepID=A0A645ID30_9ZZZZ
MGAQQPGLRAVCLFYRTAQAAIRLDHVPEVDAFQRRLALSQKVKPRGPQHIILLQRGGKQLVRWHCARSFGLLRFKVRPHQVGHLMGGDHLVIAAQRVKRRQFVQQFRTAFVAYRGLMVPKHQQHHIAV